MYQMGLRLGGETLMDTARSFGLGARTGLPIADKAGLVPDNEYMVRTVRRPFMPGDAANLSIGQGMLLVTPLQIAQMMAAVANGYLPKLHLIKQIQDGDSNVIFAAKGQEVKRPLPAYESALHSVRKGMKAVVDDGTGGRAKLSYASIAGKSGTAQWGPEIEDKRLAWFAGFMPYENPRFAYVVLYEGRPHERMGGGGKAAPIVKKFFEMEKADIMAVINPPSDDIPDAAPVEETEETSKGPQLPPAVVPDNLPPGLYDPYGMQPIPAAEIPDDLDDSSDREIQARPVNGSDASSFYNGDATAPTEDDPVTRSMVPQQGDADYIPGLQQQIPRSYNRQQEPVNNTPEPPPLPELPEEVIPDAEPIEIPDAEPIE